MIARKDNPFLQSMQSDSVVLMACIISGFLQKLRAKSGEAFVSLVTPSPTPLIIVISNSTCLPLDH